MGESIQSKMKDDWGREQQQIDDRENIGYGSEISPGRRTQNGAGKGTEDERNGMGKGGKDAAGHCNANYAQTDDGVHSQNL